MGLYNMVFGYHPLAPFLLHLLGYEPTELPRFRDAMLYEDSIRILTRSGGGNREEYGEQNAEMAKHALFIKEYDDSYDSTYAWFEYKWPEDRKVELTEAIELIKAKRPDLLKPSAERWQDAIEAIGKTGPLGGD